MDLTIKILEEIRDAVRENKAAVEQTNVRLDRTNARLESLEDRMSERFESLENRVSERFESLENRVSERFESLENRVTGMELRLSTAVMEVATSLGTLKDLYEDRFDLRDRITKCETAIEELRRRS